MNFRCPVLNAYARNFADVDAKTSDVITHQSSTLPLVKTFVSKNRMYSLKIDRNTVLSTVGSADQFKISSNHKTRNS